jgi:succinyl-CoA synthetase beta subunit
VREAWQKVNIHEYQAKGLFKENKIKVSNGYLVRTPIEAEFAMRRLGCPVVAVKAQIHAGGRGKAGGVKIVKTPEECRKAAEKMFGMTLVTHQTGPEGKVVQKVYIEEGTKIQKEYYLAMLVDRETASVNIIFSTEGGMDIEEVAAKTPDKLVSVAVNPIGGLKDFHIRKILFGMKIPKAEHKEFGELVKKLYTMFFKHDFSMIEINPLVVTDEGAFIALDGKMSFDDNALYRQKDIESLRDFSEEDEREIEATKYNLSYIGLNGNIGCLVNGAGLAMATMDIIKHYGGEPANFLDVGGGATEQAVTNAFKILLSDSQVKGIFVNIFGGIMRCDVIANGIISAVKELGLKVPLVVRLEGTNVDQGRKLLNESGLNLHALQDMAEAAQKIVKLASK